jgi:tRNA pseudouridine32 synthase / 23S rRNA pseudouridine746 synthase
MTSGRRLVTLLLVGTIPFASALATSSRNTKLNINEKDEVKLVFEINDSNQCRIYLSPSIPSASLKPSSVTPSTKKETTNPKQSKQKEIVVEYEQKVERMHMAKRAKTTISEQIEVVFYDENMVVVYKPPGVLCVPDINNNPSLLDIVWSQYGNAGKVNADDSEHNKPSSMIVNRLDMDTSGLVVFGRTPTVTRELNQAFRERHVLKEYEALVCGHVPFDSGWIDLPLQRDHEYPPFMRVSTPKSEQAAALLIDELKQSGYKKQGRKKPKPSQTAFRVVERMYHPLNTALPITRLRLQPKTGRTHQLRVHCAAMGHPILGDPTYGLHGDAASFGGLEDAILTALPDASLLLQRAGLDIQEALAQVHPPNAKPMCLHAALLRMKHPVTGEMAEWTAPVPF